MARSRAPGRLQAVSDAGLRVFGRQGFTRAQMSDIAREAGVSTGTLYNYVESKEALLLLCIEHAFEDAADAALEVDLPVTAPPWDAFIARVESRLSTLIRLPALEQARRTGEPPEDAAGAEAELRAIVSELYDLIARTRRGAAAIERSAQDVPDLALVFFVRVRRGLFVDLTAHLANRIDQGLLAPVPDVAAASRFIGETVTWFARHRHHDPDAGEITDATARATAIDLVTRALRIPPTDGAPR